MVPGAPHAFVESFKGKLRGECLSMHRLVPVDEARAGAGGRRANPNESRPHTPRGFLAPADVAPNLSFWPGCRRERGRVPVLFRILIATQGGQPNAPSSVGENPELDRVQFCLGQPIQPLDGRYAALAHGYRP